MIVLVLFVWPVVQFVRETCPSKHAMKEDQECCFADHGVMLQTCAFRTISMFCCFGYDQTGTMITHGRTNEKGRAVACFAKETLLPSVGDFNPSVSIGLDASNFC